MARQLHVDVLSAALPFLAFQCAVEAVGSDAERPCGGGLWYSGLDGEEGGVEAFAGCHGGDCARGAGWVAWWACSGHFGAAELFDGDGDGVVVVDCLEGFPWTLVGGDVGSSGDVRVSRNMM
jgi:hypothetical protein